MGTQRVGLRRLILGMVIVLAPARGWGQESPAPAIEAEDAGLSPSAPVLGSVPTEIQPAIEAEDAGLPPLPSAEPGPPPLPETPEPEATVSTSGPSPVAGPAGSPSIPAGGNLGVPFGLLGSGGGQPTTAAEPQGPPFEGPGWADRLFGLSEGPVHLHGWIQNTFTGNTNGTPADGVNFALFPNHQANQWMGNQYYVVLERVMEQDKTSALPWGYRLDTLFGHDWEYTKAFGFLDHAFLLKAFHGLDFPQFYGETHLPILTDGGLDVKFGRWYGIGGYESVMAVRRPLISWPYLAEYFPFTMSGLITTFHATDRINIFNGASPGVDRWFNAHYRWSYIGGVGWTSRDGKTSATSVVISGPNQLPSFLPANASTWAILPAGVTPPPFRAGQPNPGYPNNNRTYTQNVLTRLWTDKLTQVIEVSAAFDQNTPNAGPNGTSRDTNWFGVGNWFLYQFTPKFTGIWRSEIFRDGSPFVTGVSDVYYEMTLGALYKPSKWLWLRSELRYDWAQYHEPFSDGTRDSRFSIAIGAILLF